MTGRQAAHEATCGVEIALELQRFRNTLADAQAAAAVGGKACTSRAPNKQGMVDVTALPPPESPADLGH